MPKKWSGFLFNTSFKTIIGPVYDIFFSEGKNMMKNWKAEIDDNVLLRYKDDLFIQKWESQS